MKTAGVVGQTANLGLLDAGEQKEMVTYHVLIHLYHVDVDCM
jgi:hypothetical protein